MVGNESKLKTASRLTKLCAYGMGDWVCQCLVRRAGDRVGGSVNRLLKGLLGELDVKWVKCMKDWLMSWIFCGSLL